MVSKVFLFGSRPRRPQIGPSYAPLTGIHLPADFERPFTSHGQIVPISREQQNLLDSEQAEFKALQVGPPLAQKQCLLFRLPIEIREQVYRHVFGPSLIHIEATYLDNDRQYQVRLAHVRCFEWQSGDGWDGHLHGRGGVDWTRKTDKVQDPNDQLLSLCLSCRLMCVTLRFQCYLLSKSWTNPLHLATTKPYPSCSQSPSSQSTHPIASSLLTTPNSARCAGFGNCTLRTLYLVSHSSRAPSGLPGNGPIGL